MIWRLSWCWSSSSPLMSSSCRPAHVVPLGQCHWLLPFSSWIDFAAFQTTNCCRVRHNPNQDKQFIASFGPKLGPTMDWGDARRFVPRRTQLIQLCQKMTLFSFASTPALVSLRWWRLPLLQVRSSRCCWSSEAREACGKVGVAAVVADVA